MGLKTVCLPRTTPCGVGFSQHSGWGMREHVPEQAMQDTRCSCETSYDLALKFTSCHLYQFFIGLSRCRPAQIKWGTGGRGRRPHLSKNLGAMF